MNHDYLKLTRKNKSFQLNLMPLIRDLLILITFCTLSIGYYFSYPHISQYLITYIGGILFILVSLPIMIKIIIKLILTFTLSYFVNVNHFIENFDFGYILISAGVFLYLITMLVNRTI